MKVSEVIDINRGLIGPAMPDSSVAAANALMIEGHVGALAVVEDDGRIAGILSERDIARGIHQHGATVLDMGVGEIMVRDVISCAPDSDVGDATALMIQHGFRHLPIVQDDRPLTVISMRDIVSVRLTALENDVEILRAQLDEIVSGG